MTREEFEALLEEAFIEGYNNAIDEIFEEDNTFDLEDEMDSYLESNAATKSRNRSITRSNFKDGVSEVPSKGYNVNYDEDEDSSKIITVKNGRVKDVHNWQRGWVNNQQKVADLHKAIKNSSGEARKKLIRDYKIFHDPDYTLLNKIY